MIRVIPNPLSANSRFQPFYSTFKQENFENSVLVFLSPHYVPPFKHVKDKMWHLKIVDLHFSNLNNFPSIEVVDRVSETQLQVGEN